MQLALYVHTDCGGILIVSVGLAQARPNNRHALSTYTMYTLLLHFNVYTLGTFTQYLLTAIVELTWM